MWLTLIGLVFEIVGVYILIREEITGLAAIIKRSDKEKKIVVDSLLERLPVMLAKYFGSSDSLAQESFTIGKFTKRFYGFCFLFLGFVLQVVPVVSQLI